MPISGLGELLPITEPASTSGTETVQAELGGKKVKSVLVSYIRCSLADAVSSMVVNQ